MWYQLLSAWYKQQTRGMLCKIFLILFIIKWENATTGLIALHDSMLAWFFSFLWREKFFNLLKRTGVKNVFLLSGDRHIGVISKFDLKGWGPIWEVTSSSINVPKNFDETDPVYQGSIVKEENFGLAHFFWKSKMVKFELRNLKNEVVGATEVHLKWDYFSLFQWDKFQRT